MLHKFLPSIKKDISYCSFCGCLSYKNIPSQRVYPTNNHKYIMNLDPLVIKYKPISLNIDFSLTSHINYIKFRQKGLSKIYFISNNFNIEKMIQYKAIGFMDQIFLNNNEISIENIETIASVCLLLSLEFNYCCSYSNINELNLQEINNNSLNISYKNKSFYNVNNLKAMYQYIIEEIDNIKYWQIFCLKNLDYNLGKYSAFDYLKLFFELGIVFSENDIDIISMYDFCFNLLEILINQYNICKYNQYIIAMSIIYTSFNNNIYFDNKIFKYIYGVDFSKKKYKSCINEINNLMNDLYNFKNYKIPFIYYQNVNNNCKFNNTNNIKDNNICKFDNLKTNNYINYKILDNPLIKGLFIQYLSLLEQTKINNYINFSNDAQIFHFYRDYFVQFLLFNIEAEIKMKKDYHLEISKCHLIKQEINNDKKIEN